jgi:hypothetical protein
MMSQSVQSITNLLNTIRELYAPVDVLTLKQDP